MERKSLFKRESAAIVRSQTFAIRVDSYDTTSKPNAVKGVRLDTGEAVSVFLREIDFKLRGRFKRSEIADFAAPRKDRNHPGTTPGGALLVQDAQLQAPGVFGARWIQSLSHTPGEAEVFHTTIHVSPVKQSADKKRDYSMMTIIHDGDFTKLSDEMAEKLKITPPFSVQSIEELREAMTTLLEEGTGVGVRVSNADGFDAMYVARKKDASVADAVNAFMGNIQEMADAINSGSMVCEVIPYGNIWAGPATTEIMVKNAVVQSRLNRFNEIATGFKGTTYPVAIFRPAIVAVRMTPPSPETGERAVFFSHFEPLFTRQPVKGLVNALAYARTEHLSPEIPKPDEKEATASTPAGSGGPAAGDAGLGSFDGAEGPEDHSLPPSDEPLMDAAAGMDHDIGDELPAASPQQPASQPPAAQSQGAAAGESRAARRYGRRA